MSCIVRSTNPRVTKWRNGCVDRKSRGEHLRDGILRGWKFGPGGGSARGNYFPTCDAPASNLRRLHRLFFSLLNLKWTTGISTRRSRFWMMRVCCISNQVYWLESIFYLRKHTTWQSDLIRRRRLLNKSRIPIRPGREWRSLMPPAAGCILATTPVSWLITPSWSSKEATKRLVPFCDWRNV